MNKEYILCVLALDGISSNHVMNFNLVCGLKDLGYKVYAIVINNYKNISPKAECDELFDKYTLIDGKQFEYGIGFYLKEYVKPFIWARKIWNEHKEEFDSIIGHTKPKHIISFSSPIHSHVLSRYIIKHYALYNIKYTQYWSDPICGSMMDYKGIIPIKRMPFYLLEKKYICQCKDNVFGTECLLKYQKELYPRCTSKMRYIDVSYSNYATKVCDISKSTLTIGFFGTYSPVIRDISNLIDAVNQIEENVSLIVCGDGIISENVKIGNKIKIISKRIPYEKAHKMEEECDILISLGNKIGCQVPGKTFYYAGSAKPIIYILDGTYKTWHDEYLRKFDRYIICENVPKDIILAIKKALEIVKSNYKYSPPIIMKKRNIANALVENNTTS